LAQFCVEIHKQYSYRMVHVAGQFCHVAMSGSVVRLVNFAVATLLNL
jgi:hypothetical protein